MDGPRKNVEQDPEYNKILNNVPETDALSFDMHSREAFAYSVPPRRGHAAPYRPKCNFLLPGIRGQKTISHVSHEQLAASH